MKIIQALLFCACSFILLSCSSYGKKYSPDNDHEVYYKGDGVDEAGAKKLAEFLKKESYFIDGHKATVQITKPKDILNVNFVYDKSMVDADREAKFQQFGGQISREVFNGAPLVINLCDTKMEVFKTINLPKGTEETTKPLQPIIDETKPNDNNVRDSVLPEH
jgi:hypothetical protein